MTARELVHRIQVRTRGRQYVRSIVYQRGTLKGVTWRKILADQLRVQRGSRKLLVSK